MVLRINQIMPIDAFIDGEVIIYDENEYRDNLKIF